jgi:hypothetical protein
MAAKKLAIGNAAPNIDTSIDHYCIAPTTLEAF